MKRVKFYLSDDILSECRLACIKNKINRYSEQSELKDINDLIEIYNIKRYFDNERYFLEWGEETRVEYKTIIEKHYAKVCIYFKSISEHNLISNLENIDEVIYLEDFWSLIDKLKVYENIPNEKFKETMELDSFSICNILFHRNLTNHFGLLIRQYMLNNIISAEILLNEYEREHSKLHKKCYFPRELTVEDKEVIINNYIDSENPNLSRLSLIINIQSNPNILQISPKTILKAKRKIELLSEKLSVSNMGSPQNISFIFSETLEDVVNVTFKKNNIIIEYSLKWIEENLDYATLLNNYIYLFEFVDVQMRSTQVNKKNRKSALESVLSIQSKNSYQKGCDFEIRNYLSTKQMKLYYKVLNDRNVRMENIIEWFFKEYICIEFNVTKFKISMPSESTTYLEKCQSIMPALEYVLKQFTLLVNDGEIDFDLINVRSNHLIYENIPSFIESKYVYGKGDDYNRAVNLFFSNKSRLTYTKQMETKYNNFFDLLKNEKFTLDECQEYNLENINWLLEKEFLTIKNGIVQINNLTEITILKELYLDDVISYWKYSSSVRRCIDSLKDRDIIEIESTLFSRPEADYINYLLNKSKFVNGLDLRNMYMHTQPYNTKEAEFNENNYMIFLKLFILTVIKINDDLCIMAEYSNG